MNLFSNDSVFSLQHELNKLSKLLGNHNIETRFKGEGAYTDGKTFVNLPAMPMERKLTDEQQRVLRGFHVHEVSHVQNTNFNLWKMKLQEHGKHPMLKDTWNAIEDVFIERKAIDKYKGAQRNLEAVTERVFSEAIMEAEHVRQEDDYIWAMEVPFALCGLGRIALGYHSVSLREFCDGLPDEVKEFCEPYIKRVAKAGSTSTTFKIANEVLEALKVEIKKLLETDEPGEQGELGEQGEQGEQGESTGGESSNQQGESSEQKNPGDDEQQGDDGSESSSGQGDEATGEDDISGMNNGDGKGGGLPDKTTFKDVETAVRKVAEESGGTECEENWKMVEKYARNQPPILTVEQLLGD